MTGAECGQVTIWQPSISGRRALEERATVLLELYDEDDGQLQSSTILPELPDFISSIPSLN